MNLRARTIALWGISIVIILLFLFPLYVMGKIALSTPGEIFQKHPPYLVHDLTWEHFRAVFTSGEAFYQPLRKSLVTALAAAAASLVIATPAAYAIARLNYRARYLFIVAIFVTRMIPEVSIALPISTTFIKMGLFDTVPGLVLAHLIRILPVSCFILVGVFAAFPEDLEKQARMDGYSRFQSVVRVVLPLSKTGIAVAGLFSFLLSWDEFIYASYLTLSRPTMPLKVYYYVSRGNIFYSSTYAVIITIPVLVITLFIQKYIKPGYLSGSVKG
ncbi:MAG: ABC transporter permease subunit [Candidatus Omnitrophica bacterium]|nr:ABC transporter permease subunit [Candidatus Omnitrophota bacterium]